MGDNWLSEKIKRYLFGDISDDEVKKRLYDNMNPYNYHFYDGESSIKRVKDAVKRNESEFDKMPVDHRHYSEFRDDIYAEYLGIPKNRRHNVENKTIVSDANYFPTIGSAENLKKINLTDLDVKTLIDSGILLKHGENKVDSPLGYYFADHTVSRGFDNNGDYISYYDKWDINPYKGKYANLIGTMGFVPKKVKDSEDLSFGIGNPTEYYDRVYLDDYYDIPEEARGNPFITPAVVTAEAKKFGGIIKAQNSAKLISKINQSDANFVKRLLDPNRKSIPDWETKGAKIATHKLGWAEDDQGAYVYPEVQEIDGQLIDFSRPPYAPGIADYMAHKNNNIVRMSPEEADWFTRNYKHYYPSFKKGGRIHIKKKNRGKFTEYCGGKVTEECIAKGKKSKDPKIRKRATFAQNVRSFKHSFGGLLADINYIKNMFNGTDM